MGGLQQAVSERSLARKDLNCSLPNSRFFNETFTGCARAIPRCIFCLQDDHTTSTCTINPNRPAPWDVSYRPAQTAMWYVPCPVQAEVCHNYNKTLGRALDPRANGTWLRSSEYDKLELKHQNLVFTSL